MKKFISVITAAAAVAAISATAGAYSINKDLGFGWSNSVTIGAEEFADVTPDTTVTITYNVNERSGLLVYQAYGERCGLAFHQYP
jgi:ABC-type sugar transport system substrate-binding protein